MKITKIVCDRCGKTIIGYPINIMAGYADRETGDILGADVAEPVPDLDKLDFCWECVKAMFDKEN